MGNKFKTTLGLCVGSVMNCADNTGAKNLYTSRPHTRHTLGTCSHDATCDMCASSCHAGQMV